MDTATSLGLSAWVSGGEYFRPVNGGRVIWWVNSSGALKCSVNMMPPAGTAVGGVTSGHNVPTGVHNWATAYQPIFHSTTIDHSQAEVAKTFHWREFGNGAANGGNQATYADMTMLDTTSDLVAYFMDDGLTSMSADGLRNWSSGATGSPSLLNQKKQYFTFIGTGISLKRLSFGNAAGLPDGHWAQNLSYGTHIMECRRYDNPGSLDRVRTVSYTHLTLPTKA